MFQSPFAQRPVSGQRPGVMYSQVGAETRVASATPHQLVALLFEGFMEAVAEARGAMRAGRPGEKGAAIGRAVRIIEEGLRASLDMRGGGELARELNQLYGYLTVRLTQANLRDDEASLEECRRLVLPLQEAWAAIDPRLAEPPRP